MDEASAYLRMISGARRGPLPALGRAVLGAMSYGYGGVIRLRHAYYDTWALPRWLDVPVISVGNLTVGGTGKTPMTLWLCERLLAMGRKPAVLSRGYKAEADQPDEIMLVARRCPGAVAVAHPDRVAAGELAIQNYGANVAILDDAFQHRRCGRDLDVVMIDATRPFGYQRLLPRGLLREPVTSLRRAHAVVLTRCDQAGVEALVEIEEVVRRIHPEVPMVRSRHRPAGGTDLRGAEQPAPRGDARVGAFAGIARPEAFRKSLEEQGLGPVETRWWPDHHAYDDAAVDGLIAWIEGSKLDVLVTTEKDAVKLSPLGGYWPVPVLALRVDIELLEDGEAVMTSLVNRMLAEHEQPADEETDEMDSPAD